MGLFKPHFPHTYAQGLFLETAPGNTKETAEIKECRSPSTAGNAAIDEEGMKLPMRTFFIHIFN
jgi:hypothetical protein